jgi:hypothetical protein
LQKKLEACQVHFNNIQNLHFSVLPFVFTTVEANETQRCDEIRINQLTVSATRWLNGSKIPSANFN